MNVGYMHICWIYLIDLFEKQLVMIVTLNVLLRFFTQKYFVLKLQLGLYLNIKCSYRINCCLLITDILQQVIYLDFSEPQ